MSANEKNQRKQGKRLEIRKDLLKKLGREELGRVQGGTIGCCEYWCGRTCQPMSFDFTMIDI